MQRKTPLELATVIYFDYDELHSYWQQFQFLMPDDFVS